MSLRTLTDALDDSRRRALDIRLRAEMSPSPVAVMAMGQSGSAIQRIFGQSQSDILHRAQGQHYSGWQYASIKIAAQRIAGQPIHLARRKKRAGKRQRNKALESILPKSFQGLSDELELIESHPLLDVLNNPNPWMVPWTLMFSTVVGIDLFGKAFWWMKQVKGKMQIWPVPASWVQQKITRDGTFEGWEVTPSGASSAADTFMVPPNEMAYLYYPDPRNPLASFAPMQAVGKAVLADEAIQEAQHRAFTNGIHPTTAVTIGRLPDMPGAPGQRPMLTPEQRQRMEAAIMQAYQGVVHYGKPIILDALIERIDQLSLKPREMDFLNSGKPTKERITQGYGVNPISMGQIEGANRASAIMADQNLCSINVNPKSELLSQCFTAWVAPNFARASEQLVMWIEPSAAEDQDSDRENDKLLSEHSAMTVNEMRSRHNHPPLEGELGECVLVPNTFKLVNPKTFKADEQDAEPEPQPAVDEDADEDEEKKNLRFKRLSREQIARMWDNLHTKFEDALAEDLRAVMAKQGNRAVAMLLQSSGMSIAQAGELINEIDWCQAIKGACEQHLYDAAVAGAALELELTRRRAARWDVKDVGIPSTVLAAIANFLQNLFSFSFWSNLATTVKEALQATIFGGITAGKSVAEVAEDLKAILGPTAAVQAANISQTELTACLNAGQHAQMVELAAQGIVLAKEWLGTLDGIIRPTHLAAHGQRRAVDEPYQVGSEFAMYPGDPNLSPANRCRCRCSQLSVTEESEPQPEPPVIPPEGPVA